MEEASQKEVAEAIRELEQEDDEAGEIIIADESDCS